MLYLKWALMVPVMIAVTLLTFPLAFILPFLGENRIGNLDNGTDVGEGYYLKPWLNWFQTPDNSLDGDEGWRNEHWQWRLKLPLALAVYVGRVGWLWRNPGYGFGRMTVINYGAIWTGDSSVNEHKEGSLLIYGMDNKCFQYRLVKRLTAGKVLYMNLGWNVKGLYEQPIGASQIVTFAFSPRIVSSEV